MSSLWDEIAETHGLAGATLPAADPWGANGVWTASSRHALESGVLLAHERQKSTVLRDASAMAYAIDTQVEDSAKLGDLLRARSESNLSKGATALLALKLRRKAKQSAAERGGTAAGAIARGGSAPALHGARSLAHGHTGLGARRTPSRGLSRSLSRSSAGEEARLRREAGGLDGAWCTSTRVAGYDQK